MNRFFIFLLVAAMLLTLCSCRATGLPNADRPDEIFPDAGQTTEDAGTENSSIPTDVSTSPSDSTTESDPTTETSSTESDPTTESQVTEPTQNKEDLVEAEVRKKADQLISISKLSGFFDSTDKFLTPNRMDRFWVSVCRFACDDLPESFGEAGTNYKVSTLNKASRYFFGITCDWTKVHYLTHEVIQGNEEDDAKIIEYLEYYDAELDEVIVPYGVNMGTDYEYYRFYHVSTQKTTEDSYVVTYQFKTADRGVGIYSGNAKVTLKNSPYGYVIHSFVREIPQDVQDGLEVVKKADALVTLCKYHADYFESVEAFRNQTNIDYFWSSAYEDFATDIGFIWKPIRYEFKTEILDEVARYYFGTTFDWTRFSGYDETLQAVVNPSYVTWIGGGGVDLTIKSLEKTAKDTYVVTYEVSMFGKGLLGYAHMTMKNSPYGYVAESYIFEPVE